MAKYIVEKSGPLRGEVQISGAKNAVLPLMAAALLAEDECVIRDVPKLRDVALMKEILASLGSKIEDLEDIDNYTWDLFYPIEKELYGLSKRRLLWEFFINSDGDESFLSWLTYEIWYGTIDKKLKKYYQKFILLPVAKLTAKLWKIRFRKYICDCICENTSELYYMSPCRIYITYESDYNASEYIFKTINNKSLLFTFLNLTHEWIGDVLVEHVNKDSKRELYYVNKKIFFNLD